MPFKAGSTPTIISDEMVAKALQAIFGENVTDPEALPPLLMIDRSNRDAPRVIGKKPLENRIEYRLLTGAPRDESGNLTLEALIKYYEQIKRPEFSQTQPILSGARLIVALAYYADIDDIKRKELKRYVDLLEYGINAGGNPCDGRHVVVGGGALDDVNFWLKGWNRATNTTEPRAGSGQDTASSTVNGSMR